ncbi:MAG TPA: hypothetical protein VI981_05515, partial [Candidatus Paceibacterota bacterium]
MAGGNGIIESEPAKDRKSLRLFELQNSLTSSFLIHLKQPQSSAVLAKVSFHKTISSAQHIGQQGV